MSAKTKMNIIFEDLWAITLVQKKYWGNDIMCFVSQSVSYNLMGNSDFGKKYLFLTNKPREFTCVNITFLRYSIVLFKESL